MKCFSNFIFLIIVVTIFAGVLSSPVADIDDMNTVKTRHRRSGGLMIYPGTKWCGKGNIADGIDDLGESIDVDKCCRDHDFCEHDIPSSETKYGLENTESFTMSECKCDDAFANCLQSIGTMKSILLTELYVGVLDTPCFSLENGTATWHKNSHAAKSGIAILSRLMKSLMQIRPFF